MKAFAKFIQRLRTSSCNEEICAPSFSHAKKDPVPDDVKVLPGDRFVFIEGLYANVNEGAWALAAKSYDARWLIQCDEQVATQRLKQRHVETGVASTVEEAVWRSELVQRLYIL
jgi:pantothenate kinase